MGFYRGTIDHPVGWRDRLTRIVTIHARVRRAWRPSAPEEGLRRQRFS